MCKGVRKSMCMSACTNACVSEKVNRATGKACALQTVQRRWEFSNKRGNGFSEFLTKIVGGSETTDLHKLLVFGAALQDGRRALWRHTEAAQVGHTAGHNGINTGSTTSHRQTHCINTVTPKDT